MDFDAAVQGSKRGENYIYYIFLFKADVSEISYLLLQGFERSVKRIQRDTLLNSADSEKL